MRHQDTLAEEDAHSRQQPAEERPSTPSEDDTRRYGVAATDAHAPLQALNVSLRSLIHASTRVDAPDAALAAARAHIDAAVAELSPYVGRKPFAKFAKPNAGDMASMLPFSPVTGRFNPMAPPVEVSVEEDGSVVGSCTLLNAYEGPNRCVHGSIVASIWDQILAFANIANQTAGPTAWLRVDYKRPTPLDQPLRFIAKTDSVDGRKIRTRGQCVDESGTVLTEAEGLFILPDPSRGRLMWKNER